LPIKRPARGPRPALAKEAKRRVEQLEKILGNEDRNR
jgi:hypothetical protein